jgi:hypothetical protein
MRRPKSRLAILPGLTHYNIFAAPALASAAYRSSTKRWRRLSDQSALAICVP